MILSDQTIRQLIQKQVLAVEPLTEEQIQPASVDLRLGTHYLKINEFANGLMTLEEEMTYEAFESEEVVIPPQSFLLANYQGKYQGQRNAVGSRIHMDTDLRMMRS